jgi:hypothetical protein
MGRIDTDNTGQVEGDEFVAALVDWGQLMQTQEWNEYVDAAFSRLDMDGDGFIELEELLTQMPQGFLEGWAPPGGAAHPKAAPPPNPVCPACRPVAHID